MPTSTPPSPTSDLSLSRAELDLMVEALRPELRGAWLQRVYEADPRTTVLQIRAPGQTHNLLVSTEPGYARMHEVANKPKQPPKPSTFTMLLRKWLSGGAIDELRLVEGDRILLLDVEVADPEFDYEAADEGEAAPRVPVRLVAELTGQHGNLFLLDGQGRILGQQHGHSDARELRPGARWEPPPRPAHDAAVADARAQVRWDLDALPPAERSAVVEEVFDRALRRDLRAEVERELRRDLKRAVKKLRRRQRAVEGDLERAEQAQQFRVWGELLQSAYGKVKPGAESARVPNYYDAELAEVEIPLDPAKSLKANIERYFHEYRRLQDASGRIESRLLETMELLEAAEQAREALQELEDVDALLDLRASLLRQGVLERPRGGTRRASKQERKPYREFHTERGATILVGRGSKSNDELTTRHARGRDVWLHARDFAGAHVVLRMGRDDEPHPQDLRDAALLAAHFSKGKEDTLVDVTYTRAKHVRKPKGAAAGLVTVAGGSTIAVSPDAARLQALLEAERR